MNKKKEFIKKIQDILRIKKDIESSVKKTIGIKPARSKRNKAWN